MALDSGTRIGHYEILDMLGAGGMGEVYRARDRKLGRDVALKILPATFAGDAVRLARFEREATALAALNHPNIAQIYGVEESGPVRALVMELVDGDDLSSRLARRALAMDEALPIARRIAEALAAAHQAGIVHRDLKPANIKVRPDGEVKVLDFGIAKSAADVTGPDAAGIDGATLTVPAVTHAGVILGTAAYMAPEQAKGLAVDRRADIWAFGCVVFEMLTGRRTFDGASVTEVLASVLTREPDWSGLPEQTPDSIRRLLRRCLQKDPKQRLHDIDDARLEIDDALAGPPAPVRARRPAWWALAVGGVLLMALGLALGWFARPQQPAREAVRSQRLTDMPGLEETPALSPDGRSIAFTAGVNGKRRVFIQLLEGGAPLPLTRDDVDHQFPRWTSAGNSVVYFSPATPGDIQGTLWEIPALGGAARRVVDSTGEGDVNSDGRVAFFRLTSGKIELVTASLDGSSVNAIAQFEPGLYYQCPRWSPDGKWIAYQQGQSLNWDIFVVPATGGQPRQLTNEGRQIDGLAWTPDGRAILYSSPQGDSMLYLPTARLWQVSLESGTRRQVTSGEVSYVRPDIAKTGTVVASRVRLASDIWTFPVDGTPQLNTQKATRVTQQTGPVLTPTASPDGREVAFLADRGGHANVWVIDVATRQFRQLTHERDPNVVVGVPVWSPQGDSIAFVSSRGHESANTLGIWIVNRDGSNLRSLVSRGVGPVWSPDGRLVYFTGQTPAGVSKIAIGGGTPVTVRTDRVRNTIGTYGTTLYVLMERPLVDGTPGIEIHAANPEDGPTRLVGSIPPSRVPSWQILVPTLSPDGKWIAQALTDRFSTNIWALSTATGEWRQITDFGDRPTFIVRRVSWSSDGRSVLAAVAEGDADVVLLEGLMKDARD